MSTNGSSGNENSEFSVNDDLQKRSAGEQVNASELPTFDSTAPESTISPARATIKSKPRYFGDYELLAEIVRGGMGVVYQARHIRLNRIVALKMIIAGELASDTAVQRFQCEAQAAARLDHPGIVPIHEIGELHGQHFYAMAFVDGQSLGDIVRSGSLHRRRAARLVQQVAETVA